jgi:hypothetical protein
VGTSADIALPASGGMTVAETESLHYLYDCCLSHMEG